MTVVKNVKRSTNALSMTIQLKKTTDVIAFIQFGSVVNYSAIVNNNANYINNCAYLHNLHVDKEYRGLEIGSMLLKRVISECELYNINTIVVDNRCKIKDKRNIYSKMGFVHTPHIDGLTDGMALPMIWGRRSD